MSTFDKPSQTNLPNSPEGSEVGHPLQQVADHLGSLSDTLATVEKTGSGDEAIIVLTSQEKPGEGGIEHDLDLARAMFPGKDPMGILLAE